ncbi:MAG TPA: type II secretion system F family protein [Candidatus Binataceae bacterium]|nr:type II secretion system F family protein [Candidatus Binataceae bacterium]
MDLLIVAVVFASVFFGLLAILSRRGGGSDRRVNIVRRMARPIPTDIDITRRARKREEGSLLGALWKLDLLRRLEESMWQAGLYMRVSEMTLIIVLMFGGGLFFGQAMWHDMPFALSAGAAFGAMPLLYIRFRRTRRLHAFIAQLPFALDLIKSSLEAGSSLSRSLQSVVQEFGDPLGSEFRTVLEQTRIGLPLPRALEGLLKRVPEEDLRLLVVAVRVHDEIGTSLALIVGRLAEIVRMRQRLRLQIKALTAQSRLGGVVVALLPVFVLGAFSLIQPGYAGSLFSDPAGLRILKFAAVLDVIAFVTIRRMLRVGY